MLAVIKTGGKQYLVEPGTKIHVEKLKENEEQEITFSEVLLLEKEGKIEIGKPLLKDVKVIGRVVKHFKGEKVIVFKHKPRKRYKLKKGHRQLLTEIEILKIE